MSICAFSSLLCLGDPQISIFSSCHSPEHLYNPFLYLFTNIFLEPLKFLIIQRELISPPLNWHCSFKLTHLLVYLHSVHLPLSATSLHPAVPTLLWQPSFLIWFIVLPAGSAAPSIHFPHYHTSAGLFHGLSLIINPITKSFIAKNLSVMDFCFCFCHSVSIHLLF